MQPVISRRLFVDTSAYFALTDKRDENHEAAVHLALFLEVLTSNMLNLHI
jgi:predicted nucleic acid-binding protein